MLWSSLPNFAKKKPEFFLESERCVLIVNVVFIHHQVYGEFILQITMFTSYDFYVLYILFYVILPCLIRKYK